MKRKILALALVCSCIFAMAGCGNKASEETVNLDRKEATVNTDTETVEQTSDNQNENQQETTQEVEANVTANGDAFDLSEIYDLNVKAAFGFVCEYESALSIDIAIPAYSEAELGSSGDDHFNYLAVKTDEKNYIKDEYSLSVYEVKRPGKTAADVYAGGYKSEVPFIAVDSVNTVGDENSAVGLFYGDFTGTNGERKLFFRVWDFSTETMLMIDLELIGESATSASGNAYCEQLTNAVVSAIK